MAPHKGPCTLYYMKVWREIETATLDMMNGKYGALQTLVIDGIHKAVRDWTGDCHRR